jgi:hypothetical protein
MKNIRALLVSGPSGGGKSTFIDQLVKREVSAGIGAMLPEDCSNWPVIEINDLLKGNLSMPTPGPEENYILHYDIVMIHRYKMSYEDDPAIELLRKAREVHEVFVRPDANTLRAQFAARKQNHEAGKSRASLLWAKAIRHPSRRLAGLLGGKPSIPTWDLYSTSGWLESCYEKWITASDSIPVSSRTIIESSPSSDGSPSFRLADPPPGS